MSTRMVYKWLFPLPTGRQLQGAVSVPVQEMLTEYFVIAPLPWWYTPGERAQLHLQVRPYLHHVICNVRAATQNFTRLLPDYTVSLALATSVCEALLVIDSVQIPGVPKCLMCESPVAGRGIPAAGENMLRYTFVNGFTGAPNLILDEIKVYPSWRVDSPPKLCAVHSQEFEFALKSVVYGCAWSSPRSPVPNRSYDSSSPSDPQAPVGPSS